MVLYAKGPAETVRLRQATVFFALPFCCNGFIMCASSTLPIEFTQKATQKKVGLRQATYFLPYPFTPMCLLRASYDFNSIELMS